jgi:hypothetical protein
MAMSVVSRLLPSIIICSGGVAFDITLTFIGLTFHVGDEANQMFAPYQSSPWVLAVLAAVWFASGMISTVFLLHFFDYYSKNRLDHGISRNIELLTFWLLCTAGLWHVYGGLTWVLT